ncbi:hypothetical protein ACFL4O_00515 [bacterium]
MDIYKLPNRIELYFVSFTFFIVLFTVVLMYTNYELYYLFAEEDGFIEWLSVLGLFMGSIVCAYRFFKLRKIRSLLFLVCLLLAAFALFFGAGEEMSWGQRVFDIKLPLFFQKYNFQKEINVHNLLFKNFNMKYLIFGRLRDVVIIFYLFVLPWLYKKRNKIKKVCDRLAVPIPYLRQIIIYAVIMIILQIVPFKRKWELMEMAGAFIFFVIIFNPCNREIYNPDYVLNVK